ncbi:MAG TPA: hypothetical protein VMI31_17015 [Fimbriimonadaceae bacterium]|nr:hypothetical protein [Fimbriimonadaceae bacterium]
MKLALLIAGGLAALAGSWFLAGLEGLAGCGLAAVLAALSVASLRLLVDSVVPTERSMPKASGVTAAVILVKLPAVALIIYLATRLAMPGIYCFLATLGLVYSAVVWRLARADA